MTRTVNDLACHIFVADIRIPMESLFTQRVGMIFTPNPGVALEHETGVPYSLESRHCYFGMSLEWRIKHLRKKTQVSDSPVNKKQQEDKALANPYQYL